MTGPTGPTGPTGAFTAIQNQGVAIAGAPHNTINFVGVNLIASNSGGGVAAVTSSESPTELGVSWQQTDIAASQTNVALQITGNANFTQIRIVRDGWLCGLSANLSTAITTGTLSAEVTRNGAGTGLTVSMSSVSHPNGDVITRAKNVTQVFAGDLIGVRITSNATFAPTTNDIICVVDLIELVTA